MYNFNVRVYGLLINDNDEVLISDEQEYGMKFTRSSLVGALNLAKD